MVYHRIFSFGGGGGETAGPYGDYTGYRKNKGGGGGGIRGVIQISIKHSLRQDSRVVLSYPF